MVNSDQRTLRNIFGRFATGVTIITTTNSDNQPVGFTANSFTSVSLDPPLVLFCIAKSSENLSVFERAESFAVNILAQHQKELSTLFASKVDRYAKTIFEQGLLSVPVFSDSLAVIECKTQQVIDSGDHLIILGLVKNCMETTENSPLLYYRGDYQQLNQTNRVA